MTVTWLWPQAIGKVMGRGMALAIAPILMTPIITTANPLEVLHGETYSAFSSANFGVVNRGLPEGFENAGGRILGDSSVSQPLVVSVYKQGEQRIFSLEQILERQRHEFYGVPVNEQRLVILDSIATAIDGTWFWGCQVDGAEDLEVLAIAPPYEHDVFWNTQWFTEFREVWRANRDTQQFEAIAHDNVRCINPSIGI